MAKASPPPPPAPKKAATPAKPRAPAPQRAGKGAPAVEKALPVAPKKGPPAAAVKSPRAKSGMRAKTTPPKPVPPPTKARPKQAPPRKPKKARARPRPRGRPSLYTKKLAAEICRRVANGEYLSDICRGQGMPDAHTVHVWVVDDRKVDKEDALELGFSSLYARAQDDDCDRRLKEIEDIARTPVDFAQTVVKQETVGGKTKTVKEVRKGDSVPHRQLLTSNLQWIAIRQHRRRLAMGRDAMREQDGDDAPPADGELRVVVEGGLPADGAKQTEDLPPDPFTDEPPE